VRPYSEMLAVSALQSILYLALQAAHADVPDQGGRQLSSGQHRHCAQLGQLAFRKQQREQQRRRTSSDGLISDHPTSLTAVTATMTANATTRRATGAHADTPDCEAPTSPSVPWTELIKNGSLVQVRAGPPRAQVMSPVQAPRNLAGVQQK